MKLIFSASPPPVQKTFPRHWFWIYMHEALRALFVALQFLMRLSLSLKV